MKCPDKDWVDKQNWKNQPEAGIQKVKLCLWPALRVYLKTETYILGELLCVANAYDY